MKPNRKKHSGSHKEIRRRGLNAFTTCPVDLGGSIAALGGIAYGLWPDLYEYDEELVRQRKVLASDPELRDFVRYATLAANGHNTQPWKFRIAEDSVSILRDLTRRTEVVDPDDHHLFVSLGCAAENLLISAKTYGRPGDVRVISDENAVIEIGLGIGAEQKTQLYDAILRCHSASLINEIRL